MGKKLKRGKAGNAVQYVTRNQALKKLQLHLSDFRRLCILKGIHPREPKKKTQGQGKTYYHVKDISFLAHEPLLNRFRDAHAHERKIRRAKAKANAELAHKLATRRPGYHLDHLVRERYPSFLDALRDLDDPLTMLHLFSTLPAEKAHAIPAKAVHTSRRLALEWQSYVVRTHALRKVFVSVKGFCYQAEVLGQQVTWLVPHQLAQVLPTDVDYRVMLTFLEFYQTMLKFVNFKLYHMFGAPYPPTADSKLQAAAADLAAIMQDLAALPSPQPAVDTHSALRSPLAGQQPPESRQELPLPTSVIAQPNDSPAKSQAAITHKQEIADAQSESESESDDEGSLPSINSGDEGSDTDNEAATTSDTSEQEDLSEDEESLQSAHVAPSTAPPVPHPTATLNTEPTIPPGVAQEGRDPPADAAAEPEDEGELCGSIFKGLVFFLAREVPQEALLLIIRSFGGTAGWLGVGSPLTEADESITHQVVDRPTQGHKFLSRDYVQPQWVLDSANFRVMVDARLYAPGIAPPPHLSPFVSPGEDDYVPDYARSLARLQEAAKAARRRAQGRRIEQAFLEGADPDADVLPSSMRNPEDTQATVEQQYAADLAIELQAHAGNGSEHQVDSSQHLTADNLGTTLIEGPEEEEAMKKALMPRKHRIAYESIQRTRKAKRARTAELKEKSSALARAKTVRTET